jgi:hypothetical protein
MNEFDDDALRKAGERYLANPDAAEYHYRPQTQEGVLTPVLNFMQFQRVHLGMKTPGHVEPRMIARANVDEKKRLNSGRQNLN